MNSSCTYVKVNHFEKEFLFVPGKDSFTSSRAHKYKLIFYFLQDANFLK